MNKLLSIVIPFYNETEGELRPLLSTIATQKGVDFSKLEVIFVNDGCENMCEVNSFFEDFPHLNITLVVMDCNRGSGVARQVGLDKAVGKYVMFCDCDDLLHSVGVLGGMLQEMELHKCEFLSTSWLEECVFEDGTIGFVPHEQENTWLHGKMFLRSFVLGHNIQFHPELRVHEDTYFLSILCELATNKRHLPITSYVWTYNPDSITRKESAIYTYSAMGQFIYAMTESIRNLEGRGGETFIPYKVVQLLVYIYLIDQSKALASPEVAVYRKEMRESLSQHMGDLWHYYHEAEEEFVAQVYWEEVVKMPRDMHNVGFADWVQDMEGKLEVAG